MAVAVAPGNDPFAGGSKTPNAPPPALGGSIAPAQTSVANPMAGVAAGSPFFARNNRGSNIGLPYSRLCPLGGERSMMGLGPAPDAVGAAANAKRITETDDLRPHRVAFILGPRAAQAAGKKGAAADDPLPSDRAFNSDPGALGDNSPYGFQMGLHGGWAPGLSGTERFQKLCSFEYLHRYFSNVLCHKALRLYVPLPAIATQPEWETGVLRQTKDAIKERTALRANAQTANDVGPAVAVTGANTLLDMPDLGRLLGFKGSPAADAPALRQGIFARDTGPFLRGKGSGGTAMLSGTPSENAPASAASKPNKPDISVQPHRLHRCMGDEVAFALLERQLEQLGLSDWRPDGIVLSLGANDPDDKLSDEALAARDGQLFNVRIQGPAMSTSWTGDPALEVLPGDRVFVCIVADVWYGDDPLPAGDAADFLELVAPKAAGGKPKVPTEAQLKAYLKAKEEVLSPTSAKKIGAADVAVNGDFDKEAVKVFKGDGTAEVTRLVNFRPMLATSSQMVNYSAIKFDGSDTQMAGPEAEADASTRVGGQSRMGLRLSKVGGEYIVGGWQIGQVLDSAASRGGMPGPGANMGVRTAPNTAAHTVNVQVDWWDADRMWRTFMNVEGSLKPRFVATPAAADAVKNPINRNPNDFAPSATPKPLAYA